MTLEELRKQLADTEGSFVNLQNAVQQYKGRISVLKDLIAIEEAALLPPEKKEG